MTRPTYADLRPILGHHPTRARWYWYREHPGAEWEPSIVLGDEEGVTVRRWGCAHVPIDECRGEFAEMATPDEVRAAQLRDVKSPAANELAPEQSRALNSWVRQVAAAAERQHMRDLIDAGEVTPEMMVHGAKREDTSQ